MSYQIVHLSGMLWERFVVQAKLNRVISKQASEVK